MDSMMVKSRLLFPQLRGFYAWAEPFSWLLIRATAGLMLIPHGWPKLMMGVGKTAEMALIKRGIAGKEPLLIDAQSTRDQADPYVIALAVDSVALGGVSILSDDRRDRHDGRGGIQKLSVATAAGLWDIPVVPIAGFLLRFPDSP